MQERLNGSVAVAEQSLVDKPYGRLCGDGRTPFFGDG